MKSCLNMSKNRLKVNIFSPHDPKSPLWSEKECSKEKASWENKTSIGSGLHITQISLYMYINCQLYRSFSIGIVN